MTVRRMRPLRIFWMGFDEAKEALEKNDRQLGPQMYHSLINIPSAYSKLRTIACKLPPVPAETWLRVIDMFRLRPN